MKGKINISDEDLILIINTLEHRIKKINKYLASKPVECEEDQDHFDATDARRRLNDLSRRLRYARAGK